MDASAPGTKVMKDRENENPIHRFKNPRKSRENPEK